MTSGARAGSVSNHTVCVLDLFCFFFHFFLSKMLESQTKAGPYIYSGAATRRRREKLFSLYLVVRIAHGVVIAYLKPCSDR